MVEGFGVGEERSLLLGRVYALIEDAYLVGGRTTDFR